MFETAFEKKEYVYKGTTLPYRLRMPDNYDETKCYPLMLFLHGAGERGNDNEQQLRIGIGPALEDKESPLYNAFIIAPQCFIEQQWVDSPWYEGNYSVDKVPETIWLEAAHSLVREYIEKFPINKKKVFVSGISMGGFGSWDSIARHPDMYAGGFICCGAADPTKADIFKEKTIFTYHGACDNVVPTDATRETTKAIISAGGKTITYREFPDVWHDSWTMAFSHHDDMKALFEAELN